MSDDKPGIHRFLLRVVIWLPLAFAAWYLFAPALIRPVVFVTDWVLSTFMPQVITEIGQQGNRLRVVTALGDGAGSRIGFALNPLMYGYSLPLLAALILAVPESLNDKWGKLLWGVLLLVPVQAWGLSFEVLKVIALKLPVATTAAVGITDTAREFIALGYQFGYLILPAVSPLVIWLALYRNFVGDLVPQLAATRRGK
ncbi:MAG: hypothetical protein KDG50_10670 [Chromatiales bacterium]|nr:hypothetical protein [Chromatiales bacterium]